MGPSSFGRHQIGVRWKTVRCSTSGAIDGMTCTAEAPVPMTATRLPASSTVGSQRAVCIGHAGEIVEPVDVRALWPGEHTGRVDHVPRRDLPAVAGLDLPDVARLVERRLRDQRLNRALSCRP